MPIYKDPILVRIREVLEKDGPRELVGRYSFGDPGAVNKSDVEQPRCFISYDTQSVQDSATGMIQTVSNIIVNVVYDMTRDHGQGMDNYSHMSVVELVTGRTDDFALRTDSIVGALRKNQDMSDDDDMRQLYIDVGTPTEVEFDALPRNHGLVTAEGIVHFTVISNQLISEYS